MIVNFFTHVRSLLGIVFIVPYTAVCACFVVLTGSLGLDKLATRLVKGWGDVLLFIFGIKIVAEGEGNLPARGGAIIVFNHQSHFDIPAICTMTTKNIRFGAKIELFKIPMFGAAMRAVGTLPIARENRTDVFRVYKEAEARFAKDFIFVLAPEGTRQSEPKLGRFKKGPFLFARNAGVPIVPVVIKGAHAVLPKKSLGINIGRWSRTVYVKVLPPVDSKPFEAANLEPFVEAVRVKMVEAYDKLPG
ncbi:MAG: lysophospholipid acyltransferase family protein [Bdellovibrionota bacterium]